MSRSPPASAIDRINPNIVGGYRALGGAPSVTGLLGLKINRLIALAVALALRCDDRVAVHTVAAARAGATDEEIAEVVRIATRHADAHAQMTGVEHRLTHGGLAPWQIRRTEQILRERLNETVTVAYLAGECRLSVAHFARAFKRTTGQTPHRWLLERRVENAKRLLVTSALPLAEIAAACGFADQSHFTRAFCQIVGTGPGTWRRAWKECPIDLDARPPLAHGSIFWSMIKQNPSKIFNRLTIVAGTFGPAATCRSLKVLLILSGVGRLVCRKEQNDRED